MSRQVILINRLYSIAPCIGHRKYIEKVVKVLIKPRKLLIWLSIAPSSKYVPVTRHFPALTTC